MTPMKQEKERCCIAIEEEKKGKQTLVCSGDMGFMETASLCTSLGGTGRRVCGNGSMLSRA